ncbi:MAG: FAD/NAD-binding family oxidoreductase [Desulfovibrionaceae bacterium]|nr:FAD/NAD-binding family oxidoreductase [Desulfovibrionaceae bacterium]MBF0514919.1 FAD/NAD-binding family oxidoreductase [Desulfovibrionaceae bacterium]
MPDAAPEGKVLAVIKETDQTNSLVVDLPNRSFLERKPGQYATIRIKRADGWSEPHPFTISCPPAEGSLLRFTIKKAGGFTSAVPDFPPGAPVRCAGPFGAFCKDIETHNEIVMIAGGVGITPFLSVLRHFRDIKAQNRIQLFWCNKTLGDAFSLNELAGMTRELSLRVVHVLSREKNAANRHDPSLPAVTYESGRLARNTLLKYGVTPGAAYYLCGPGAMQDTVLAELAGCGVDPGKVEREKFGR